MMFSVYAISISFILSFIFTDLGNFHYETNQEQSLKTTSISNVHLINFHPLKSLPSIFDKNTLH